MTQSKSPSAPTSPQPGDGPVSRFLKATEIDTRLLGMIGAIALIWIGFHVFGLLKNGNGTFLTPRNLWNLSVQAASWGIMASGMVLVIVTRNIDLSVGSMLGVTAVFMGMVQVDFLPPLLGLGHPAIWILAVLGGLLLGTVIGAFQGWVIAYSGVPAFIVTLSGLLIWRGIAYLLKSGATISPLDPTFSLLGGGPYGSLGSTGSWIVGALAAAGIVWLLISGRRQRRTFDFPLRPLWAEWVLGLAGCGLILGAVLLVDAYPWPAGIVKQYAEREGITVPEGGLFIAHGFAIPVIIVAVVGITLSVVMGRTRFGRYVFAIGGNPDAAALAGINTKLMTVKIFAIMGFLSGLAAVVSSARLNSATNSLGTLDELYVIASAVIGGTSLSGGIGTIYGAILGAFLMQSLQTGMVLLGFDSAMQGIVVGAVLALAVWIDIVYRRRLK